MKVLSVILVLLGLAAFCAASYSPADGCESLCIKQFLYAGAAEGGILRHCFTKCLAAGLKDDTVSILKTINTIRNVLKENIQPTEIVPIDESASAVVSSMSDAEVEATSEIARNAVLVATTTVNLRSGPCTDKAKSGSLSTGQSATATGESASGCGYTWYKLTNGAWVASSFVNVKATGFSSGFSSGSSGSSSGSSGSSSSGSSCSTRNYPLFKQCGQSWSSNSLGSKTVCSIGCLMSSVSMALNSLGKTINGQSANPGTLNAWLKSHGGYQGNLFVWSAVSSLGLRYQNQIYSQSEIKSKICARNVVILNVNSGGHWVLATGVTAGGDYLVNDPGFARSSYKASEVVRAAIFAA